MTGATGMSTCWPSDRGRNCAGPVSSCSPRPKAGAALGATGVVLGGNPPVHLWPGIDVRYRAMTCLAERAGYEQRAEAVDMAVDLGSAELDTGPDEIGLPPRGSRSGGHRAASRPRLVAWLREGPWGQSSWPDEAAAALARDPAGCHVASREGYLGFACHGAVRRSWFGPMGTLDTERGRGIGAVLLKRSLADLRAAGLRTARIGWVGPQGSMPPPSARGWSACTGDTGGNCEVACPDANRR